MADFDGYEALFHRHFHDLVGALWSYCGDRGLAEEAAQEAFVRASRDWHRVSRMASPIGWLHRVGVNEINGQFRRRAAFWRAAARHGSTEVAEPADVAGRMALHEALQALPRRQRAALALHYFAGLPVIEIAGALDVREGTAKSLLSRGRHALLDRLREPQEAEDAH